MANAYRRTPFDWSLTLSFGESNFECEIAQGMIYVNRTLHVSLRDKIGEREKKCPTLTLTRKIQTAIAPNTRVCARN